MGEVKDPVKDPVKDTVTVPADRRAPPVVRIVRRRAPCQAPQEDSLSARILAVARGLPQPFDAVRLVLACWRTHPDVFGLRGYPQYPDSARVLPKLSELKTAGYVASPRRGRYTVLRRRRST